MHNASFGNFFADRDISIVKKHTITAFIEKHRTRCSPIRLYLSFARWRFHYIIRFKKYYGKKFCVYIMTRLLVSNK